ncbi:MAG: chain A iron centre cytochrome C protein [Deltaproteobacteria bacterium CG_4_10_14_3_um_filter_60_8]|nr:MAG: chain A iron centre cytochrome C protein [Deltaproteobacteria bacterium CG23_combo_of_CG06-09_8_20_14_all_60_8]PIY21883.1 MAG: chain A iron centre cytochrome C protein [Deltaproteobacteria bacterium CG_4_10_14_3_um_filter_60_8]
MKEKDTLDEKGLSRRQVIAGAGVLAAGAAMARFATMPSIASASGGPTEKWPWPYVKLDPATTAELAYNEWYRLFCGGAVISSVFTQLREKVGEPYRSFPIDSFVYMEGGLVGWGTLCGSNNGAALVANMIIGPRIAGGEAAHHMSSDMLEWYSNASMPVFVPKNPKVNPDQIPHTVSESPLCHVSVGKWMKAANKPLGSPERKDRCARVAASVAYHLVEMLNAWKDGKYEPASSWGPVSEFGINAQQNCMECHGGDVPTAPIAKKS